ncbi:MAG: site-specific integrase, partial [Bdellovibrionales bacterium]|nr:site-specific integrase [Bdellovibrionales bacterium]
HNGVRSYDFLFIVEKNDNKTEKRKLAETIRAAKALELESEGTNYVPKHKKKITVAIFFDVYLENYKLKDIRSIRNALNKFRQFLSEEKRRTQLLFSSLNQLHIEEFRYYLVNGSGLKGETPYSYWKRFKKVLKHARKQGYIKASIYEDVKWQSKNKKAEGTLTKQVLTEEEIAVLKTTYCGNDGVKRAFLFSCYTGLGYAEFKNLFWKNIVNDRLVMDRAKTGQEINIKLSREAIELLGDSDKQDNLVFDLKHKGKFLSEVAIKKNLTGMMKRAGIDKNITFYCGRHTFAVRLLTKGANLKTGADAMGHTTTAHTIKYLNYVKSIKDDATSNLD